MHPLHLQDGSRIAIVGGGPSGSFFALHILDLARRKGLRLEVVIFEGKDFGRRGPPGCNKCAGILSSHLIRNLHSLQLNLPPQVIMNEIQTYVLHLDDDMVEINQPEPARRIVSVYRGAGPRLGDLPLSLGFDSWLLGEAQQAGAQLQHARVSAVHMAQRPMVVTRAGSQPFDLVVLATGVNSRQVHMPDLSYMPPTTMIMSQDELAISAVSDDQRVHVFCGYPAGTLFSCLVPKGPFVNVSLLGPTLKKDSVGRFLELDRVKQVLSPLPSRLCGCNPRIAVSMAHSYYADRFVAVGDAAVTRLYKDGIGSAFLTARQAARVALQLGVSEASFKSEYAPFCEWMQRDNRIGRMLFAAWGRMQRNRRLRQVWLSALKAEEPLAPARQHCRTALWNLFTGDDSYHSIGRQFLNFSVTFRLLAALVRAGLQRERG